MKQPAKPDPAVARAVSGAGPRTASRTASPGAAQQNDGELAERHRLRMAATEGDLATQVAARYYGAAIMAFCVVMTLVAAVYGFLLGYAGGSAFGLLVEWAL